ncbi:hypothetical protein AVEN_71344-1 [Araneus ventricosus]|uniref:Uncharacterized protein n=1 Tax=Araneus ventricosus TaxID=182803 RepID=A0A4Y2BKK4_ARAVE|nr:hypothetical protein AVEN_71344-1 [Araneus ventricosus]
MERLSDSDMIDHLAEEGFGGARHNKAFLLPRRNLHIKPVLSVSGFARIHRKFAKKLVRPWGLVVRLRLQDQRVQGSNPDSTEDPPCMGPVAHYSILRGSNVFPLVWCGSYERERQLRRRPDIRPRFEIARSVPK